MISHPTVTNLLGVDGPAESDPDSSFSMSMYEQKKSSSDPSSLNPLNVSGLDLQVNRTEPLNMLAGSIDHLTARKIS
ncbi:hypothetical protein F2Q70_00010909 [Brassica cretica]|uniref:Uncharacterized protein n=1 Tax=Brassica cretica TaxID=69181 RepID=A0A8S9M5F7_BRACR|nr:hypothetical protein F2Q70_00010909 [Brassica cretica]